MEWKGYCPSRLPLPLVSAQNKISQYLLDVPVDIGLQRLFERGQIDHSLSGADFANAGFDLFLNVFRQLFRASINDFVHNIWDKMFGRQIKFRLDRNDTKHQIFDIGADG